LVIPVSSEGLNHLVTSYDKQEDFENLLYLGVVVRMNERDRVENAKKLLKFVQNKPKRIFAI
jgi:hypothetical protein